MIVDDVDVPQDLVDQLGEVYAESGVWIWLRSRHRQLDMSRPIDLIRDGRIEEVRAVADYLTGGAW